MPFCTNRYSAAHLLPTDRPGWSGKDGDKRPDLTAGPVAPVGWRVSAQTLSLLSVVRCVSAVLKRYFL